jgi:hypothetical protein
MFEQPFNSRCREAVAGLGHYAVVGDRLIIEKAKVQDISKLWIP